MSAAALTSTTRNVLGTMVEKEARRVGSRSIAYENVAAKVGSSASWVRKFVANSNEVKEPRLTLFNNIRAAYDQLCERIESENRADELRMQALRGQINAVTNGFGEKDRAEGSIDLGEDT